MSRSPLTPEQWERGRGKQAFGMSTRTPSSGVCLGFPSLSLWGRDGGREEEHGGISRRASVSAGALLFSWLSSSRGCRTGGAGLRSLRQEDWLPCICFFLRWVWRGGASVPEDYPAARGCAGGAAPGLLLKPHTLLRVQVYFSFYCWVFLGPCYFWCLNTYLDFFTKSPPGLCSHVSLSCRLYRITKRVNNTWYFYTDCCVWLNIDYSLFWLMLLMLHRLSSAPKANPHLACKASTLLVKGYFLDMVSESEVSLGAAPMPSKWQLLSRDAFWLESGLDPHFSSWAGDTSALIFVLRPRREEVLEGITLTVIVSLSFLLQSFGGGGNNRLLLRQPHLTDLTSRKAQTY